MTFVIAVLTTLALVSSAAAAEQFRIGHLTNHTFGTELERTPQRRVPTGLHIAVDALWIHDPDPA